MASLYAAPVYITYLIAGSDGKIDDGETKWAEALAKIRSLRSGKNLSEYYMHVDNAWDENFNRIGLDISTRTDRVQCIVQKLQELNPILQTLSKPDASELYDSLVTFARGVAEATGGFLGFGAVSPEEHRWLDLPMLSDPAKSHLG